MQKRNFTEKGITFERISKKAAKKAYIDGKTVFISAVNIPPFGVWNMSSDINKNNYPSLENGKTFDMLVNSFEYYNCFDSTTGKYAAFYIPVENI